MNIKVKKLNENAKLPFRATSGSAGADLFARIEHTVRLEPSGRELIPTGLSLEIPEGFGGFIFPRSSLASKHGVSLSNCVGVIDSDYRGELKIPVINHGTDAFEIGDGDRIAQLVVMPFCTAEFSIDNELSVTERGDGGFGSTGA
ncbi:MAG: dUTP diphosphatase [Oscillospiraceae bacterium]|nr:dUTP diphosphatase [Oscillospiraceae bacterium]